MKKAMLFALSVVTGVYAFDFGDPGSGDTGSSDDGYDWTINDPVDPVGPADVAGSAPSDESDGGEAFDGPDPFAKSSPFGGLGSPTKNMSFGGGLFFLGDFGGGVTYEGDDAVVVGCDERVTPVYGIGLHTFFDYKKYVTAGLSLYWGGGSWESKKNGKAVLAEDTWKKASFTSINIDVLGKYPFEVKEKMTAFPLLGIAYHIVVSGKNNTTDLNDGKGITFDGNGLLVPKAIDLSALWFKFGGGLDYALNERFYIRSELMYGIRLANGYENDILAKRDEIVTHDISGDPRLGHGLTVRVGVGYNL